MKTIKHTSETLPPLTEAQRQNLKKQAAKPDDQIISDEMPELTTGQLAAMQRSGLYRPVKQQITTRIDADVLAWLKSGGKGYQSRINDILRQAMMNAE